MEELLLLVDNILFVFIAVSVLYLFIFALFSMRVMKNRYPKSRKKHSFLVLIPAYREDKVIMDSVKSALAQDYPAEKLEVAVISDKMRDETNIALSELPITLFVIDPEESSKGLALHYAMENVKGTYDMVVILDADNMVNETFISDLNDVYHSGSKAIQAHRVAKNINTEMAVLDAISEEINNSIFRRGHVNIGLSSALIGSGMALEFKWFKENSGKLVTAGEDKELEILLLKEGVFIDFLDDVLVYDEKVEKEQAFYNQRRRWLAAQYWSFFTGLKDLPKAILKNNIDFIDKVFQWALFPRIILIGLIVIISALTTLLKWEISIKWWILFIALMFTFAMAIPDYLVTKENSKAIKRLPIIFILMVLNMFRLRGATKKFIHTEKG